jgi:hypothetical protein
MFRIVRIENLSLYYILDFTFIVPFHESQTTIFASRKVFFVSSVKNKGNIFEVQFFFLN